MMLLNFGCSLALGAELPDCQWPFSEPSALAWPALIAKQRGLDYRCHACGGCGNFSIMDRVLTEASLWPQSIFIINWTFIDRFDYSDPNGCHYNQGFNDYLTLRPSSVDPLTQYYYRYLHSEYRDKLAALTYIMITINQLTERNIKFVMTSVDNLAFCTNWHAPKHVLQLQERICPFIQQFGGLDFLAWSSHQGYAVSSQGHPLEEAHMEAANLMLPAIDAILHTA